MHGDQTVLNQVLNSIKFLLTNVKLPVIEEPAEINSLNDTTSTSSSEPTKMAVKPQVTQKISESQEYLVENPITSVRPKVTQWRDLFTQ